MLNDFSNIVQFSLTIGELVTNLSFALICGVLISIFYKLTYRGGGYTSSFLNSLVILTMITSIVIMVIGNNLARAFGLVGAMSIIRFRTALKETTDIIFIFFSLAIGMAAGVGLHVVALAGTIFVGIVFLILSRLNILSPRQKEYLLQFTFEGDRDQTEVPYVPLISKYARKYKLVNVKSLADENTLELSYYVNFKKSLNKAQFIQELKRIDGVGNVNIFFDEEYF